MISIEEILEILIVAVILFGGSKKIPELARSLGRASG
ncbi:twin-arginine translocase TatA/TatE family subunit [Thermogymnomonas acidicola]|nr:twin-arginine translocase TatA/TatE family subunit [Thermogymnomonas acidicola]